MYQKVKNFNKEFKEIKREIINRDGWECQLKKECYGCLDVHHIIRRSQSGTNKKENLITLCRGCHDYIELLPAIETVPFLQKLLIKKYK